MDGPQTHTNIVIESYLQKKFHTTALGTKYSIFHKPADNIKKSNLIHHKNIYWKPHNNLF